jgi:hypothetical protein
LSTNFEPTFKTEISANSPTMIRLSFHVLLFTVRTWVCQMSALCQQIRE